MKSLTAALAVLVPFAASAAPCDSLAPAVERLLSAYSAKNLEQVDAQMRHDEILVLGSDLSEVARTPEDVSALMKADFRLWGEARFGAPRFMDCRMQPDLATAAFDAPFEMQRNNGSRMSVTVRFLTVWTRDTGGRWLLTQSLNSTPTVGESAADLLKRVNP